MSIKKMSQNDHFSETEEEREEREEREVMEVMALLNLEKEYELNPGRTVGERLLKLYFEYNRYEDYFKLFLKLNGDTMDPFHCMFFKLLDSKVNEMKDSLENKIIKLENQLENQIYLNTRTLLSEDWKDEFHKLITIETPINIEHYNRSFIEEFEAFGLSWALYVHPRTQDSDEFSISLLLYNFKCKEKDRDISEITISIFISPIMDTTKLREFTFKFHCNNEENGYNHFQKKDYFFNNNTQVKILVGMKVLKKKYCLQFENNIF